MIESVEVNGVPVNLSNMEQALEEVRDLVSSGKPHYVCFFEGNLLHCVAAQPDVREVLKGASLCYPDGVATAKLASWASGKEVSRVSGPSFFLKACEYGISHGWRHFFFGGKEGVADELAAKMKTAFPGLQVAGTFCPPFREMTDEELSDFCRDLKEKHVDLLWVALGGPKQEKWMHQYLGRIPVPVMLGVGAAFDFHTAHQAWAPKWIRKIGMEWLWRMTTGGRRVFWRNLACVSDVAWQLTKAYLRR